MGELFNNPHEWRPLISERLIDYIRGHLSQVGGLTPARKIAILAEQFGVKTAWHGPGDVSPVGHTAQLHLDLASSNIGIHEGGVFTGVLADIFKGCPAYKDGFCRPVISRDGESKWMSNSPPSIPPLTNPIISTADGEKSAGTTAPSSRNEASTYPRCSDRQENCQPSSGFGLGSQLPGKYQPAKRSMRSNGAG